MSEGSSFNAMATGAYLTDDDGDLLAALRFRWRSEEGGEKGCDLAEFANRFREWRDAHRDTHFAHLVTLNGTAVGCAWLVVIDRVPGPERFLCRGGMLQSVYVVPEHRGRGLGTELVGEALATARAEGLDYVMVHPSAASFPFYRRLGFAHSDRVLELRHDDSAEVDSR